MASTGADRRSRFCSAVAFRSRARALWLLALLAALASAASASAAASSPAGDAGGTSVGATSTTTTGSTPAKPTAKPTKPTAKPSLHVLTVRITAVSCVPYANCSGNPHQVSLHGLLALQGVGLKAGMVVAFPRTTDHSPSAQTSSFSPSARLRQTSSGLVVEVPKTAHSGHIMILLGGGRYTSSYGPIYVYAHALHPPPPPPVSDPPPTTASTTPTGTAFEGQGMWIWYLSASDHGNLAAVVAQAHAAGVTTLFIKSSDGPTNFWSQFTPQLVAELHAGGLKVCAWQYVYGSEPVGEAALGAQAAADGADCLVIDAESEYEGRYAAAQTYIDELRAKIGPNYPVGLASFPYNWDHPSFPYSVFLGPNGAQFNAPQMYWKDIGQSVDTVYANTYIANRIYGRPIFPLGQTFEGPSPAELLRF
ncbi:MAG TPA: hypothetical protein VED41_12205, partial [Solirubrobacteraceae bacterium]|nr:hypothetical protein [Solirubrobacteraceae bacterium]